jgi:hypothetical protein
MNSTLFKIDPTVLSIFPQDTTVAAAKVASKILRSDKHVLTFANLYETTRGEPHIDSSRLKALLQENEVFALDRIRLADGMNARAATYRDSDCWRIFFNPLLLLEMVDREREDEEFKRATEWVDLIGYAPPFVMPEQLKKQGQMGAASEPFSADRHRFSRQFNSIVFTQQKRITAASVEPATKKAKSAPGSSPSTMTVKQKHVLMLILLLVHEAQHLLNRALSALVTGPKKNLPPKAVVQGDPKFSDVGHLMEKILYGSVIQHGYDDKYPANFAVCEVLGTRFQGGNCDHYILHPRPAFLHLLDHPDDEVLITDELLELDTGDVFEQKVVVRMTVQARHSAHGAGEEVKMGHEEVHTPSSDHDEPEIEDCLSSFKA